MTRVSTPSREDLLNRRAAILRSLGLTGEELAVKVASGGLVGDEWSASAEIEEIEYLLEGA
jgi:hypothetical protein